MEMFQLDLGYSLIPFSTKFWSDFLISLIPGLAVVILGKLAIGAYRILRYLIKTRSDYRINGNWIGTCNLPSYQGVEAIEIYNLRRKKERINFQFFNYRPYVEKKNASTPSSSPTVLKPHKSLVQRYEGFGICRGKVLSAFYYIPKADRSESGVFVVQQSGERFKGMYAQYDLMVAGEKLKVSAENFVLTRTRVSLWAQLKMLLHRPPYATHEKVDALYKKALETHALPDTATVEPNARLSE